MCLTASASGFSFIEPLHAVSLIGSTVPSNGDLNPYGIADVRTSIGSLVRGDVLVSNFNDEGNEQGTGTTIVEVAPNGDQSLFAQIDRATLPGPCPGGIGLTTALSILPDGYVVVGSLPTSNGQATTAKAGCLLVLSPTGKVLRTISGPLINGPWDMTAVSSGPVTELFVTNVLNGTVANGETVTDGGSVVRIVLVSLGSHPPLPVSAQLVAYGFPERTDPEALVLGPTGDALGHNGTLYVADTQGNRIAAIPDALSRQTPLIGNGMTIAQGGFLDGPLGLTLAPDGDILTTNAGDGNIVETSPAGQELSEVDTGAGGGGLFGLTLAPELSGVYFVNDAENTLELLH
jgi:hypothetical protein